MLDVSNVALDPVEQFATWFEDAKQTSLEMPEAVAVATASKEGRPSVRMVLCKEFGPQGFVFYTHYESAKSNDLTENPYAELLFHWEPLHRQVRIRGVVERTSREQSEAYFQKRPRGSQIGAWSSPQSQLVAERAVLEQIYQDTESRYAEQTVPCPPFWGGYCVIPERFEFWQGRDNRFHDRICYTRGKEGWEIVRLAP